MVVVVCVLRGGCGKALVLLVVVVVLVVCRISSVRSGYSLGVLLASAPTHTPTIVVIPLPNHSQHACKLSLHADIAKHSKGKGRDETGEGREGSGAVE